MFTELRKPGALVATDVALRVWVPGESEARSLLSAHQPEVGSERATIRTATNRIAAAFNPNG